MARKSDYEQVYDGEWFAVTRRGHKSQCCSCGLVHRYDYRVRDSAIELRATVDKRATAAVRRGFKFSKDAD
jgi:hypothetical protein